jgi:cytoskeleton protein RodZ
MTLNLRPSRIEEPSGAVYRQKPDGNIDPAGETGWFLQREREQRGKTLADAALETHINAKYLHAIEMGVLQDLPARSYVLGYIRVYAEFLGLDAKPLLEHYEALIPASGRIGSGRRGGGRARTFMLTAASAVFIAAMSAVVWYVVPGVIGGMSDQVAEVPANQTVPVTPQSAAPDGSIETGSVDPRSREDAAADAIADILDDAVPTVVVRQEGFVDTQDLPVAEVPDTGLQPEDLTSTVPPGAEDTAFTDDPNRLTDFIRQHVTEANNAQSADAGVVEGVSYGIENENARIVLRAIRAVWIRIEDADGSIMITRTLKAGDTYRVPDQNGLVLIARDGGALEYSIDGRDQGTIGAAGEIVVGRPLDFSEMNRSDG